MRALVVSLVALAACTEKNPRFCSQDSDCADPALPFCDVNGEFPESGGAHNLCTPTPADCPVDRCGCTPGEALACDLDQLTVCAEDGRSTMTETCALGCSTEDRCLTFEPSNGLGPALEMAADEPDVVLPPGTRIDTDTGVVTDGDGTVVPFTSIEVVESGAPGIRVFIARSLVIEDVVITGGPAIGFVASTSIRVKGRLDVSAQGRQNAPGALDSPAACVGRSTLEKKAGSFATADGAGGGGAATIGARGGTFTLTMPEGVGGATANGNEPLVGGCRGGSMKTLAAATFLGGGGGGAVQLVSGQEISLTDSGVIDVGGGGGESSGGGGSGGLVIIETPRLRFQGATVGIAANGGAGGACDALGADASPTTVPAAAPLCGDFSGGNGGTGSALPTRGRDHCESGGTCIFDGRHGGGGGSVGRARLVTGTGTFDATSTPILSAAVTAATLDPK